MNAYPGFQLPPGFPPGPTSALVSQAPDSDSPGTQARPILLTGFSGDAARALIQGLVEAGESLALRPVQEIVAALGEVGSRFLDPSDPLRMEAEARLPDEAGVSPPMARAIVEGMARDWTGPRLGALVSADFPDAEVLDGFRAGTGGAMLRAVGDRFAVHIGAGSVPGVGATSLLRSLLVKAPLLLKPGRGDISLPCLLARGLAEAHPWLAAAVAVVYWPGSEGGAIEAAALERAERVVVYGGGSTVSAIRSKLPPTTPVVAYHHRISMGAVAREVLGSEAEAVETASHAAMAAALFDRRGCVSPQIVWVEEGGVVSPSRWAEMVADRLEALERTLPSGPLELDVAAGIQHGRGAAELRRAAGSEDRIFKGKNTAWTVFFEPDPRPSPTCGGRTIRVKPIARLEALPDLLAPYSRTLQTIAIAASSPRRREVVALLARSGASRFTTFEKQPWPPAWWRHDGQGPLLALVRWVEMDS